ncbi:uncharacterized protein LOC135828072 [Sycon ciliatum]|uniref:uncharacterized protein LOC135828072 n=1 Tax=Sycon ciliatum TaxID=27933 RepID=UPI0031F70D7A
MGPDSIEKLFSSLAKEDEKITKDLRDAVPLSISVDDEQRFLNATNCWICEQQLDDDRVRDHDHVTGRFRGAAHSECNLKLQIHPAHQVVPVFFHNLKGYDAHLLISHIGLTPVTVVTVTDDKNRKRKRKVGGIEVIATNMERYISFKWTRFKFVDSIAFLNSSLDRLAGNTPDEAFQHLRSLLSKLRTSPTAPAVASAETPAPASTATATATAAPAPAADMPDDALFQLLRRKGVYPYEYMDSMDRFSETSLPPRAEFHSSLSNSSVSEADYAHGQRVWQTFDCHNLGDYHDLYLQTDVNLLADIFENFRRTAMRIYGLDPAHYLTLPGFAWDALLKMTRVSLTLLSDNDMHLFLERGLRGGVSMAATRHCRANNKHMTEFNQDQPSSYIQYLDANNLYGWAMCQRLPITDFKWCDLAPGVIESVLNTSDESEQGYMVECDLSVPADRHHHLNDYPPAPEKMSIDESMLSPYQLELRESVPVSGLTASKLVPNLLPKSHYVLHYRNLKLYLRLGLKLDAVHRILRFKQEAWMQPYIMANTELRKAAQNEFERDFFKLMNNAVFGKTMENVRRRVGIRLLRAGSEEREIVRAISKPTFVRYVAFDNELIAVENRKKQVSLNKPVYVGMAVLDLSKELMYSFFYDQLKVKYGDRVRLLYTDTDSLILNFLTDDLYEDMKADLHELYDTSNYPAGHPLRSDRNKKVVGKMKDELGGKLMTEFVGLRSKVYCFDGEASGRRAKGVKKNVTHALTTADYRQCLLEKTASSREMTNLRSHEHRIYTETTTKLALSPFDSKRYILADGFSTLAFGHRDIPQSK